jgi:hypothetical protein
MKADIAWVHTDEVVNLRVVDHIGIAHAVENVRLVQELKAGDGIPAQNFCTWMPYQKVQAAKTDEAAKGNVPLLSTQSKQHRRKLIVEIMRTHGSNVTADQLIEMATALDGWVRGEAKP